MNSEESESNQAYEMLKIAMRGKTKSHKEIVEAVNGILTVLHSDPNNLSYIVDKYEENNNIKAYNPDILVDYATVNSKWLIERKESTNLDFFNRYKDYLKKEDFPEDVLDKMQKSTEKILSYCADPANSTTYNKK